VATSSILAQKYDKRSGRPALFFHEPFGVADFLISPLFPICRRCCHRTFMLIQDDEVPIE
jgi:hypothetical protein